MCEDSQLAAILRVPGPGRVVPTGRGDEAPVTAETGVLDCVVMSAEGEWDTIAERVENGRGVVVKARYDKPAVRRELDDIGCSVAKPEAHQFRAAPQDSTDSDTIADLPVPIIKIQAEGFGEPGECHRWLSIIYCGGGDGNI